jgi:AraC-like DNA-binding protein
MKHDVFQYLHDNLADNHQVTSNHYLNRVLDAVAEGLRNEFNQKLQLRNQAHESGWNARLRKKYQATLFTAHDLALRVDKVSLSKLTRELKKLSAPPPGELIKQARLALAKRLLRDTRILIRDVAEAAGYHFEKNFSSAFHRATGMSPSEYRRRSIQSDSEE